MKRKIITLADGVLIYVDGQLLRKGQWMKLKEPLGKILTLN